MKKPLPAEISDVRLMEKLDDAVTELNGAAKNQELILPAPRELTSFLEISENLADLLVKAAQANLNEAENAFKEAQAYADKVRADARQRAEEMTALNERLRQYSATLLAAHKKFAGEQ